MKSNASYKENLNKFFSHSSFQIEENPGEVDFTDSFLLKDSNKVLLQSSENKNFLIKKYKCLIFTKVVILRLKLLFEYYKILSKILLF